MDRRELFKSFGKPFKKEEKKEIVIFPPYFLNKEDFAKSCVTCEDKSCRTVCEEDIIIIDKKGIPRLDLQNGGCTYCDECAITCEQDVLDIKYKQNIQCDIKIDTVKCLSWQNTMCFSCKDPCIDNAIDFFGMFKPTINQDKCTSCGFCISVCPTNAIIISKE